LSGLYATPIEFVSVSNFLIVAMTSDISINKRGFEVLYYGKFGIRLVFVLVGRLWLFGTAYLIYSKSK